MAKKLNQGAFQGRKLEKTRRRRHALESERRLASTRESTPRNDLLPELSLREVEITSLVRSPRRARVTTAAQLERVVNSIAVHGFSNPILVRRNEVIDGEIRLEAALKLGMSRVPVIDCAHLTDEQVRTLRLAANRIGELGEWDLDRLKIEFTELIELEVDLSSTSFSPAEIEIVLLDDPTEEAEGESDPPEVPVTQLGDIWEMDAHRAICGNSLEAETYALLLGDEKMDLVLTDPPYNVPIAGNVSGLGKKTHDEFVMASGELDEIQWQQFLDTLLALLVSVVASGAVLFVFMDWRSMHRVYAAGFAAKLKLINLVVWYKEVGAMGLYRSAHELIAVFCHGDKPHTNNIQLGRHGRDRQNVWCAPGANRRGSSANEMLKLHATPKPVELCVDAILDVTRPGHTVLDAFLGSGTTLIAAEKTGRRCRGIELDPRFVDVTVARWMRETGKDAVLAKTGETFGEVRQRRLGDASGLDNDDGE